MHKKINIPRWDKINIAKQSPISPSKSISPSASPSTTASPSHPEEKIRELIDELKSVLDSSLKGDADILRIKFLFDQIDKELKWID